MTLLLGLGIIGSRCADQLTAAAHPLKTWNRSPKERPDLIDAPAKAAEDCEVILSYLRDSEAVAALFEIIRPALAQGKTFINHATIDADTTRWLAEECAEIGCDFLDAPFTGSRDAAAAGELVYYVAGDPAVLEKHRSLLEITSKAIVFLGEPPAATVVKITTNLVTASAVQAVTEALEISRRHGVDPRAWHEAAKLNGCYAGAHAMKIPTILEGDFTPHFSTKNMLKDVDYASLLGMEVGLTPPVALATGDQLNATNENCAEDDFSSLIKTGHPEIPELPCAQIRVSGPDATRYLNGQLSNDVELGEGEACLLNAKGQLEVYLAFQKDGDDFLIQAPISLRETLLARLDKYLIADDVTLTDESDSSPSPWHSVGEFERVEAGTPRWPNELFPGLLPPDAGLEERAISYTKGCYTGQEVISRMKRAGKTNKHLVKLTFDKPLVPTTAKLMVDGKEAGWITSVAGLIGLGYRLRKFENAETFEVQSPSSGEIIATATLRS